MGAGSASKPGAKGSNSMDAVGVVMDACLLCYEEQLARWIARRRALRQPILLRHHRTAQRKNPLQGDVESTDGLLDRR
jgi:hypothetical protein